MRLVINFIKLLGFGCLLIAVVAITGVVALTHYQGEVSGLELMAFENRPLGLDPLVGWIFEAVTPDAGFANWTAASITGLIMLMSWLACHHAFALIRLIPDARVHIRQGRAEAFWRTVADHMTPLLFAVALLAPLLMGDAFIFQYRALAGVLDAADPLEAARTIPAVDALPADSFRVATISFLGGDGLLMYLAMGIAPAVCLELIGAAFFETLAKIAAEFADVYRRWIGDPEVDTTQVLYGYDVVGQPVFDPAAPIAYDVDQNPVQPSDERSPREAGPSGPWPASNDSMAASSDAGATVPPETASPQERPWPVIGGADGEEISLADASAQPDRFYVTRNPRAVYAKPYWDALHAGTARDIEPEPGSEPTPEKEAA